MLTTKVGETTYKVELYDWDVRHNDYLAGKVMRFPTDGDSDSDSHHWRFYPANDLAPICAGDLKRLSEFIVGLNAEINQG